MNASVKAYKEVCRVLGVKPASIKQQFPEVPEASLVIVPNQTFTYKQLIKLAEAFGRDQPYGTYVYEDLYKQYSAEELSGEPTKGSYRYLYIPHAHDRKFQTVKQQRKQKGHVPTVLEAIAYWFVLKESGEELAFDKTFIRHYDLPEKRLEDWSYVPYSYVSDDGRPRLYGSYVGIGYGRLAVGENLKLDSPSSSLDTSGLKESIDKLNENLERIFK